MITQEEYEERIVAFIDILGFREQIKKTITDSDQFIKVKNALNFIAELKESSDANSFWGNKEITVFSDSIIISYPFNDSSDIYLLLLEVADIQLTMIEKGILLRGGITCGKLCHHDNLVYGPAMIEAYDLETSVAIYPRVVFDNKIFNMIQANQFHSVQEQIDHIRTLLHKDRDGQFYVDFLRQYNEVDDINQYLDAMITLKNFIEVELSNSLKTSIHMKYEWIKNRFNTIVKNDLDRDDLVIS